MTNAPDLASYNIHCLHGGFTGVSRLSLDALVPVSLKLGAWPCFIAI